MNKQILSRAALQRILILPTLFLAMAFGVVGCAPGTRYFIMQEDTSMIPTLAEADRIIVRPIDIRDGAALRYSVIAFRSPVNGATWVMRVVALPGESVTILTNSLSINGAEVTRTDLPMPLRQGPWVTPELAKHFPRRQWVLACSEVFVVGDNLSTANDSRYWGPLQISTIIGAVDLKKVRSHRHRGEAPFVGSPKIQEKGSFTNGT